MSTQLPIKVTVGRLPLNYNDKPKLLFRSTLRRMRGEVTGVVIGQTNGSQPTSDIGVWVNGTTVYLWDSTIGAYAPNAIVLANSGFMSRATAGKLTANRAVNFPAGTGAATVAYLADVYIPRPTALGDITSATFVPNVDLHETFYGQIKINATVVFVGTFHDGKKVTFGILNNGTAYTLTWPAGIVWPGGGEPTQPVAAPGGSGLGIYTIRSINGTLYGNLKDASPASPTQQVTFPAIPRNYGNSGNAPRVEVIARLP